MKVSKMVLGKSVEIKKPFQLKSVELKKTMLSKNDEIENSTFLTIFFVKYEEKLDAMTRMANCFQCSKKCRKLE